MKEEKLEPVQELECLLESKEAEVRSLRTKVASLELDQAELLQAIAKMQHDMKEVQARNEDFILINQSL